MEKMRRSLAETAAAIDNNVRRLEQAKAALLGTNALASAEDAASARRTAADIDEIIAELRFGTGRTT